MTAEQQVKQVCPDAVYMYFGNSKKQHHIRLYSDTPPYCGSVGIGDTEEQAWQNASNNFKRT